MKGIYILDLVVEKDININIGALKKIKFKKGNYVYIGSAQNGIENRIKRHLNKKKNKFWHIDYFLSNNKVKIKNIFYKEDSREECRFAKLLMNSNNFIKNFGSSDCKCKSHLLKVNSINDFVKKHNLRRLK